MPFGDVKLNDGNEMPAIAFGSGSTMKSKDVTEYVEQALENGFTHLDTAAYYANEEFVGAGIRESGLARDDLFVTTKYDGGDVRGAAETSLQKLGLKQVDLYLIHFPQFAKDLEGTWREFERLKDDGLAKSIGVSNFNIDQLKELLKIARTKPAVNQIFFHPYNWKDNKELLEFSTKHDIVTESYSSLVPITRWPGGPVDPVLATIAKRIGGTPAQVIFKWVASKGVVIVTTTTKKSRLQEYLEVAELPDLTDAEITALEEAGAKGPPVFRSSWMSTDLPRAIALILFVAMFYVVGRPTWIL